MNFFFFTFNNVCFVVKYLVKNKIFLVNQIALGTTNKLQTLDGLHFSSDLGPVW